MRRTLTIPRFSQFLSALLLLAVALPAGAPQRFGVVPTLVASHEDPVAARIAALNLGTQPSLSDQTQGAEDLGAVARGQLVAEAWGYLGVRYRYGGLTRRGIDCSGLVRRVLTAQHLDAPRTVHEFWAISEPIGAAERQAGDLVFFRLRGGAVSHIGIYLGGDSFVHASTHRGVTIDSLSDAYYGRSFAGARRLRPDALTQ